MARNLLTYPSEQSVITDPETGNVVRRMTNAPCINHPPYFLTSAFTPDGQALVFTSYRTGTAQLYEVAYPDGEIRQLTQLPGVHPYSAAISCEGAEIFFVINGAAGGTIAAVSRDTAAVRTILEVPGAQLGECSLSPDGRWLVTAAKQEATHGLAVAAVTGGGGVPISFRRTVIHPQFHPGDPDWIEFAADPAPRMHRIRRDGSGLECLYEHTNDEFVVHETFLGDDGDLVFTVWPHALMRLEWRTRKVSTIAHYNAWHIAPSRDGATVLCDTNHPDRGLQLIDVATGSCRLVCHPRSSNQGTQWRTSRYALPADFARSRDKTAAPLSWMEMPTDTVYGPQWTHPHPAFGPDERVVTFTSDETGQPQVYVVELPGA